MRNLLWPLGLLCLAGCSSGGDSTEPKPLTGDRKLNRCLATLGVTTCQVGTIPATNPGVPTKVRASLAVTKKSEGAEPADKHRVQVGVYDPEAGKIGEPDGDGNSVLAVGGALIALTAPAAAAWYVEDRRTGRVKHRRSRERRFRGDETRADERGAGDGERREATAATVWRRLRRVMAIAPLKKGTRKRDRGRDRGRQVIREEVFTAVSIRMWWTPP